MAGLMEAFAAKNLQSALEADDMPTCLRELLVLQGDWQQPVLEGSELPDECVDWDTKAKLEQLRIINWCDASCLLYPLNTNADDDARFHTINKRNLNVCLGYLRSQINTLKEGSTYNKLNFQLVHNSRQLSRRAAKLVNDEPNLNSQELSILALANILCQPIIVLGESTLSRKLAGIYLPLRRSPYECSKIPLVIAYNRGHFMPLIGVRILQHRRTSAVPLLLLPDFRMLPMKRVKNFGKFTDMKFALINYLNITLLETKTCKKILSVSLSRNSAKSEQSVDLKFLFRLQDCCHQSESNDLNCSSFPAEGSSRTEPLHLNIPVQDMGNIAEDDPPTEDLVPSLTDNDFLNEAKERNERHLKACSWAPIRLGSSIGNELRKDLSRSTPANLSMDDYGSWFSPFPSPIVSELCTACCKKIEKWQCEHLQPQCNDTKKGMDSGRLSAPLIKFKESLPEQSKDVQ